MIRKRMSTHPDAVDPRDFIQNIHLSSELIEGHYVNAYIFRKMT